MYKDKEVGEDSAEEGDEGGFVNHKVVHRGEGPLFFYHCKLWIIMINYTLIFLGKYKNMYSNNHSSIEEENKNDHRSGVAVKEGCPYLCIKHIIKLFFFNVF